MSIESSMELYLALHKAWTELEREFNSKKIKFESMNNSPKMIECGVAEKMEEGEQMIKRCKIYIDNLLIHIKTQNTAEITKHVHIITEYAHMLQESMKDLVDRLSGFDTFGKIKPDISELH